MAVADSAVDMVQRVIRAHAFLSQQWVLFCSPNTHTQYCKCIKYLHSYLVILEIQKSFNASRLRKRIVIRWALTVNLPVQLSHGLDMPHQVKASCMYAFKIPDPESCIQRAAFSDARGN